MALAAALVWTLLAAPAEAEVQRALDRVRASDRYQTEIPAERAPDAPPHPREPASPRRGESRSDPPDPDKLQPVWTVLFWLLAGAVGVAAAVWLLRELEARRLARASIKPFATAASAAAPAPAAPLPRHEALASEGQYAEAIHAILLLVLAAIGRAHAGMRPAWTSREILGVVKLEGGAQDALASLVRLVEVTRFGGAPAGEGEYRRALGWLEATGLRRAA